MGLREKKKQATRRHISNVATGLIAVRGFDNVTVAEIAEAAGVSKMTVFNYFPRKEDLVLDRHADRLRELEQVIREREPGESVTRALRRYHQALVAARHPLSGTVPGAASFLRMLNTSPALVARTREQAREVADLLTGLLEGPDARLVANLIAATLESIYEHVSTRMLAGDDPDVVHREQPAFIDRAFDLLEQGIGEAGKGKAARAPAKARTGRGQAAASEGDAPASKGDAPAK